MGFGLCFVGFLALTLDSLGLDFIGYLLLAFGFLKVARTFTTYKGYRLAGIAALAASPLALLSLYSLVARLTGLSELPDALSTVKAVYLSACGAVLCMAHCESTAVIAKSGGGRIFALRARATAYISALYYAVNITGTLLSAAGTLAVITLIGRYFVPLLNALLLFTCFTTITTVSRAEEEKRIIEKEGQEIRRRELLKRKGGEKED